jgi:hypothetical protein
MGDRQTLEGFGPKKSWVDTEIEKFESAGFDIARSLVRGPFAAFTAVFEDPTRLGVATATVMSSPHMFGARGGLNNMATACMNPATCMKMDWRGHFMNAINYQRRLLGKKEITWGQLGSGNY